MKNKLHFILPIAILLAPLAYSQKTPTNGMMFATSLPATCSTGQTISLINGVDPQSVYICTATNTWKQESPVQISGVNGVTPLATIASGPINFACDGVTLVCNWYPATRTIVFSAIGISSYPLCAGFSPLNQQFIQFTTSLTPSPCITSAAASLISDQTISLSHIGNFTQGQIGAAYSIIVTNSGTAPTAGTITVTDIIPLGLTATAMAGSGWSCTFSTGICTRADVLAPGASYPAITMTVTVSATSANVTNNVSVSGGGEVNLSNDSASDPTTVVGVGSPDFSISMSHTGNFSQGQTGATFAIIPTNSGTAPSTGTVTATSTIPTFLTATAISGSGWSCTQPSGPCTRSDALPALSAYPTLTLTVNVASNTPTPVIATAGVSGGGESNTANNSATDSAIVTVVNNPDMTISKSHTGNFIQGQVGAAYTVTVTNSGTGPTTGTVTMVDTVPAGLTATAIAGPAWACTLSTKTCTRSDVLAAGASYPAITLTVTVSGSAASSVTNSAAVSGGGEVITSNDTAVDVTGINTTGLPVSDLFNQGSLQTSIWTFVAPSGGTQSMTGTDLQLNVPGGANHDEVDTGTDNSVRVIQNMGNVDFTSTVRFDSKPTMQYQFEGIKVEQDTNSNFLRFQFGSDGTNMVCNADTVIAGVDTNKGQATIDSSGGSFWLQIQRSTNTWTLSYSLDGSIYTQVASFTQAITVNKIAVWGGNFNVTPASSPAFTVLARNFTGSANSSAGGGGGSGPCGLGVSGMVTNSGPITLGPACNGTVIEHVHISGGSGPCVQITNASNITIHNSEIGPCAATAVKINGGSAIKLLDNYIHPEVPAVVNNTGACCDIGDGVWCTGSANMVIQGNVIAFGEDNIFTQGCLATSIKGNFTVNPLNLGNRGANIQVYALTDYGMEAAGTVVDSNYAFNSNDTAAYAYAGRTTDSLNAAANTTTWSNNYIVGGGFAAGCGLNMDGANTKADLLNNTIIDSGQCGIAIEDGFDYNINGNKILQRAPLVGGGNSGLNIFQLYAGRPCGRISVNSNLSYSLTTSGFVSGLFDPGTCTSVTYSGNTIDSNCSAAAGTCAAYNALTPVATKIPPPAIPPVPSSCAAKSPWTNNTVFASCP